MLHFSLERVLKLKEIRILPICATPCSENELYNWLCLDRQAYKITIDRENPQYILVCISHIVYHRELFRKFREFYSDDRVTIFLGEEAISPDMNLFDYALTYDDQIFMGDRICRRPTVLWMRGGHSISQNNEVNDAEQEYERRKFCNFVYSNSKAAPQRDDLFWTLNSYQRVDSLGKHLHNCDVEVTRGKSNWFELSIRQKENYRFSIAAENSFFSGYTSEKIISSLLAHSVPVYWGNPNIAKEFNPDAFINCHDYKSMEEVLEVVKRVNEDKDLWCHMVRQPWRTQEQITLQDEQIKTYGRFTNHIFEQDIKDAKRTYYGTSVWNYRQFWLTEHI